MLLLVLILLQNYIYFGNSVDSRIYIYNKSNLNQISSYLLKGEGGITAGITDMAMFASDVQPPATSMLTIYCDMMGLFIYLYKFNSMLEAHGIQ